MKASNQRMKSRTCNNWYNCMKYWFDSGVLVFSHRLQSWFSDGLPFLARPGEFRAVLELLCAILVSSLSLGLIEGVCYKGFNEGQGLWLFFWKHLLKEHPNKDLQSGRCGWCSLRR